MVIVYMIEKLERRNHTVKAMSLTSIKRRIKHGTVVSIVSQDWLEGDGTSHFRGTRKVTFVQANGVRFEDGTWLYWPMAKYIREVEGGFQIDVAGTGDFMAIVEYQVL